VQDQEGQITHDLEIQVEKKVKTAEVLEADRRPTFGKEKNDVAGREVGPATPGKKTRLLHGAGFLTDRDKFPGGGRVPPRGGTQTGHFGVAPRGAANRPPPGSPWYNIRRWVA